MNDEGSEFANDGLSDIQMECELTEMREASILPEEEFKTDIPARISHSDHKEMEESLSTELILRYGHHSEQGARISMEVFIYPYFQCLSSSP